MTIRKFLETFNGNQKFIMITQGDHSLPLRIDELDTIDLNILEKHNIIHWSVDQQTIYIDTK